MKSFSVLVVAILLLACGQQPTEPLVHLQGQTMGTTYNIKYWSANTLEQKQVHAAIDNALLKVNQQMSTYIPDSELMMLNHWATSEPYAVSPELALVLKESERLYHFSDGLLDVTVGPLVNIWGFGPQASREKVPTQAVLDEAKANVGFEQISLSADSVTKYNPDTFIDLSTIAKGYGIDVVAEYLLSQGVNNFLVEIGGELRLSGRKSDGNTWKVGIEKPVANTRDYQQLITVGDNAIATAGDYRNFFEVDGKRFSHLLNPKTGQPIEHFLASVTVVSPSSMTADGLATAFMIMGAEKSKALADKHGIAMYLIEKVDGQFVVYYTNEFADYLVNKGN